MRKRERTVAVGTLVLARLGGLLGLLRLLLGLLGLLLGLLGLVLLLSLQSLLKEFNKTREGVVELARLDRAALFLGEDVRKKLHINKQTLVLTGKRTVPSTLRRSSSRS